MFLILHYLLYCVYRPPYIDITVAHWCNTRSKNIGLAKIHHDTSIDEYLAARIPAESSEGGQLHQAP